MLKTKRCEESISGLSLTADICISDLLVLSCTAICCAVFYVLVYCVIFCRYMYIVYYTKVYYNVYVVDFLH